MFSLDLWLFVGLFSVAVSCSKQLLLVSKDLLGFPPCLSDALFGLYGTPASRYYVYRPSVNCDMPPLMESDGLQSIRFQIEENMQILYIQGAVTEDTLRTETVPFSEMVEQLEARISAYQASNSDHQQSVFRRPQVSQTLFLTTDSALITIPTDVTPIIDTLLPRFVVPVMLPSMPNWVPVPHESIEKVNNWLASLQFSADVAGIIGDLSTSAMSLDIRYLTGEDETSNIISRHSFTQGALDAAKWIKSRIELTGARCKLTPFLVGFAPNVICQYPALTNTTERIILSAHYDSRGTFGSTRAPGGDDDGSGVISILAIARTIQNKGIKFNANVELVAFAGEEQGLLGSRAYAKQLRDDGANVTLMVQSDMLGYRKAGEPPQLGLPEYIGTPEVAYLLGNVSKIYSPELSVGYTKVCCSDHQSFHEQGYPATQAFERAGAIADPMYHNSGDVSDRPGYDFEQIKFITKANFATLLHTAGFKYNA